jgi:outer membrane lipoprotein-sorting protein
MLTAVCATLLASVLFQAPAAPQAAAPASAAPTVDEIVARNLAARGGVEKLRALETVRFSGSLTQQGMEVPMTTWAKRPDKIRQELQLQNKRIVSAFDGTTAWVLDERRSPRPQPITGPALEAVKGNADFDPVFLDYQKKGTTISLVGTEDIDGQPAYHLKVTSKGGRAQDYYLDTKTALERRTVSTMEQDGLTARVTIDFSDYRDVDGITMWFSSTQSLNGTVMRQMKLEQVEFNQPVDDALFRMPAAQP